MFESLPPRRRYLDYGCSRESELYISSVAMSAHVVEKIISETSHLFDKKKLVVCELATHCADDAFVSSLSTDERICLITIGVVVVATG